MNWYKLPIGPTPWAVINRIAAMNDWHQAENHAEKAHQFYEAGQWDKALSELKLALEVNPNQSDWHFGMGLTLEALQRYDEAIASFEQVVKLRGDDIDATMHLATNLLRANHSQRAITELEQVHQLDPHYEPSYCYRIAAYMQLGDHESAELMFYLAQQITEDCPLCYDHLALSLAMRGEFDRAIWCWQQALKIDPHYPEAFANLARAHWQCGQLDRAKQLFVMHLREDPGDINAMLQLGNLLVEAGKPAEAREKFGRVIEQEPTATEAYLRLGELSLASGNLDAATAEFEMAGRLDPDRSGVNLYLAKIAQRRRNHALTQAYLIAELERTGRGVAQSLQLAQMLIDRRMTHHASRVLDPLIENRTHEPAIDPEQLANALFLKGIASRLGGNTQAHIMYCRRVLKLKPRSLGVIQNLIAAHLENGQIRHAAFWFKRAMQLDPHSKHLHSLHQHLIRATVAATVRRTVQRLKSKFLWWRKSH